jgi:uroporphyrin-III C-methyltransferase
MSPKMKQKPLGGKVILAGAGPGDPELITLKAYRYLQVADVVISDRLVSNQILEDLVNKDALVLRVGKQSRNGSSTPQSLINELMVEYALQNKLVVRLKGGDVSFFSNVLEELQTLSAHGIAYEIIPGVTAASGAAAYAGIPLTARGYANAVRFLTHYKADLFDESHWQDLASTEDTLVFYMSSNNLEELLSKFLDHKVGMEKSIGVIEQATTPMQRVYCCPIRSYEKLYGANTYLSPVLIIIGKVASLHNQFQWMEESLNRQNYFEPIRKKAQTSARA